MRWMQAKSCGDTLDFAPITIIRRGVPWQEDPVPFRIRWKYLFLDEGVRPYRRYFAPDVEAFASNSPEKRPTLYVPVLLDPVPRGRVYNMPSRDDPDGSLLLRGSAAARYLDVSPDTIERRGIPMQKEHVPFRIRYEEPQLRRDGRKFRRYYRPDLESLLIIPLPSGRVP